MLTREEDVDAHALRRQGWSISAIARHLGRDRKTIRAYLNGERVPESRRQGTDAFVPFLAYCRQRLADDPHLWSTTLFDEVKSLGYQGVTRRSPVDCAGSRSVRTVIPARHRPAVTGR